MIDYIRVTKHLQSKDKPFFGHLELEAEYSSGWQKYHLKGCERLFVWFHPSCFMMRLEGSVMYYWQGHNFFFSRKLFVEAVRQIQRTLMLELWNAMVDVFEYGILIEVENKPREYITRHSVAYGEDLEMNEKPRDKGCFRWYEDKNVKLKMYDAGKNILHKQGLRRQSIIEGAGWDADKFFLKWEAHYLKPEILNAGKGILLADLVNPNWENVFKEDLYLQYQRLIPMRSLLIPNKKSELTTADIIVLQLVEDCLNGGKSVQEVKKMLYSRINAIPEDVLTKADKDGRKRQIKALLEKVKEESKSKWDLAEKLKSALNV